VGVLGAHRCAQRSMGETTHHSNIDLKKYRPRQGYNLQKHILSSVFCSALLSNLCSARDITKPKEINEADMIHMYTLSY
jgi:hypothetical protein